MKSRERPVIDLPYTSQEWALEVIALGGLALIIGMLSLAWFDLPALVPTHFGPSGHADAWGDKRSILILPVMSIMLYLMLTVANRYPHKFNYLWPITAQNAREQYRLARLLLAWLKAEMIILFTFLEWMTIRVALGQAAGLGSIFLPIVLGVIFGTVGIYFYFAYMKR
ncbi:MAG: hypothetical protein BroJett011_53140 [Chloroflexota bacterium]|nr:MAG: hypothetical protein BroJett011_53140 [Chloroflexota bacterium]